MAVDRVESYRIAAAWYAWGRQDSFYLEAVDVFEFADRVVKRVRAHDAGERTALSSIQDEFKEYVESLGRR